MDFLLRTFISNWTQNFKNIKIIVVRLNGILGKKDNLD